jgi:hypothetical protein
MRLTNKNDIKIFILYLLRNIGYPLDFTNVNDIMVQDEFVNYFDFAECFAELIDAGNISEIKNENGVTLFAVTEQGKEVSESLESDLYQLIREKSLKSALRLLDFKKRGSLSKCTYKELPDGSYELTCFIREGNEEVFRTTLKVDNKKMLDRMLYNFDKRPETAYRGMISLLTGEIDYLL